MKSKDNINWTKFQPHLPYTTKFMYENFVFILSFSFLEIWVNKPQTKFYEHIDNYVKISIIINWKQEFRQKHIVSNP
jgi:hypothetical protein